MSSPFSINIGGDFGPAAKALIERTADFIEGSKKAERILAIAHANASATRIEAEARADHDLIAAKAQIEITELRQRAFYRMLAEERRHQTNLEGIRDKALSALKPTADPSKLDDDWMAAFFDKCKIFSNEEMQSLWAQILAEEANSPGSFSKRTINIVGELAPKEARLFELLCRFVVRLAPYGKDVYIPLVYDYRETIYSLNGLDFDVLTLLDEAGLIIFDSGAMYTRENLPRIITVDYFGRRLALTLGTGPEVEQYEWQIGTVMFTKSGEELAKLAHPVFNPDFWDYIRTFWIEADFDPQDPFE